MSAEWEILQIVPRLEVYRAQLVLISLGGDNEEMQKFLQRAFANASLDRNKYLHAERKAGRYSVGNILHEISERRFIVIAIICATLYIPDIL